MGELKVSLKTIKIAEQQKVNEQRSSGNSHFRVLKCPLCFRS